MSNPLNTTFALSVIIPLTCLANASISTISSLDITSKLCNDSNSIKIASLDYGNLVHEKPKAVLYPKSNQDIIQLIKSSYSSKSARFTIGTRGHGHSNHGQAMARDGVVIDMSSWNRSSSSTRIQIGGDDKLGFYADVGGDQLWIDVFHKTFKEGLLPISWTDYLYLTVGGTLSNAGIGGQTFLHGPQISNVLELDVITGKGEFITCSKKMNPELFFAVLGGLGQFGLITRARIILHKAATRAKWMRLIYSDFSNFSRDQQHLISRSKAPDYVEGFIVTNETTINSWRSSFSSPSNQSDIAALLEKKGLLYVIEVVKYRDHNTTVDQVEDLLHELKYIPGLIFSTDAPIVDFLNRLAYLGTRDEGSLTTHPWLDLYIPKSRISDFNDGVLVNMIPRSFNETFGSIIFYPIYRNRWDDRMSAVIPDDEEIFYYLGLFHASYGPKETKATDELNNRILKFCEEAGIKVKQYLAHYKSKQDWIKHFGSKWNTIQERKAKFDPKHILSPGQRIFNEM